MSFSIAVNNVKRPDEIEGALMDEFVRVYPEAADAVRGSAESGATAAENTAWDRWSNKEDEDARYTVSLSGHTIVEGDESTAPEYLSITITRNQVTKAD